MFVIHDYSHLNPEEARNKFIYVANKIYTDQFHQSFFIKDPRPEYHLRNELKAFWEGAIKELHGWEDPLGQVASWLGYNFSQGLNTFWTYIVKPVLDGLEGFVSNWFNCLYDWASTLHDRIGDIQTYIGNLWEYYIEPEIVGGLNTIQNKLYSVSHSVDWIYDKAVGILNKVKDVWNVVAKDDGQTLKDWIKEILKSFPPVLTATRTAITSPPNPIVDAWNNVIKPIAEQIQDKVTNALNTAWNWIYEHLLGFIDWLKGLAPISPSKANDIVPQMLKLGLAATGGLGAAYIVGELLHPLKEVGLGHLAAMIYKFSNYDIVAGAIVGALATTVFRMPLGYYFNNLFQPKLPTTEEAGEFWRRGMIDDSEFINIAKYQGFSEEWAQKFLKTKERLPSVDDATKMYWREILTEDDLKKLIKDLGYRDKYADGYFELSKAIPTPTDLVRFVVREVDLMPEDYPAPEFFLDAMKKWGYDEYWSRAYWWSHWELPAFGQLQDAYFRGIITEDELKQYIKWHDYSPNPRPGISKSDLDIMYELIFKMPDKLDARWMRRWGIIDSEEHKQLLKAEGIHPDWIDRVALAEKMNMLADERSEIKSALRAQYIIGMITSDVLRQKLLEILYTPEETEFLIKAAEERYNYELMKDAIDAAKYNYRLGKITLEELSQRLYDLGLSAEKVQKIVSIEAARAIEARREAYGESVYIYGRDIVIRRFREGLTTPLELENELKMIGYSNRQIPYLKTVALLERDYDYAMTVLSTVKKAYRKRKIDDTSFITTLRSFGFTDDKIELELSLLKLEMGLGLMS